MAFLGPAPSSHFPNVAAETPSITMASEKIQASCDCVQSPGTDLLTPRSCVNGILKTLNEYTCPIQRWIASAAGGTSHRL